jgi:hypothetical protein
MKRMSPEDEEALKKLERLLAKDWELEAKTERALNELQEKVRPSLEDILEDMKQNSQDQQKMIDQELEILKDVLDNS